MTETGDAVLRNLVSFVHALRTAGFDVNPSTTTDLIEAVGFIGLADHDDVREGFRSVVAASHAQANEFDPVFDRFFSSDLLYTLDDIVDRIADSDAADPSHRVAPLDRGDERDAADRAIEIPEVAGASRTEQLMDIDFADLDPHDAEAVAQLLARLRWSPSSVRSRRWRPASIGSAPDMRRTLRSMTGPAAELVPLAMRERRYRQRPLIVLADISGSMERYSEMLLYFVHGAQQRFARVESFVFATRLTRITHQLRHRNPTEALGRVSETVHDWSGGTRIGDALATFNRRWLRRVGSGGPVVLIISDGWDTGEPGILSTEMARLRRNVHQVLWLNPLAGHIDFTPEARGMAEAVPHVDRLLAAGTARSLLDIVRLLEASPERRLAG